MHKYNEDDLANIYEDRIRLFVEHSKGIIKSIAKNSLRECENSIYGKEEKADGSFTYMYT